MEKTLRQMANERIFHCPECGIGNILYDFDDLPKDARKHFEEIRKIHPAMCPIVGFCPVCKKYSTMSIGVE